MGLLVNGNISIRVSLKNQYWGLSYLIYRYINDLLMFAPDIEIRNYADDTILYVSETDIIHILKNLESSISTVASWFTDNCMRLNREKYHFMAFGDQCNKLALQIETIPVVESREQNLLGITVDLKHTWNLYVRRQIESSMLFPVFRATETQSNRNLQ